MPHSRPVSHAPSELSATSTAAHSNLSLSSLASGAASIVPRSLPVMFSPPSATGPLQNILAFLSTLISEIFAPFLSIVYQILQNIVVWFFKPALPPATLEKVLKNPYGRIAIIGAGLTGVSSAAHCIAHNFDVVIFDKNPSVGGIWSNVNKTSGLQINSLLYRFHPGVVWKEAFPKRDDILSEIRRVWKEYRLESRTRLNTEVTKIRRTRNTSDTDKEDCDPNKYGHARWLVNDGNDGVFDAVIVTIGSCGDPVEIDIENREAFEKQPGKKVIHSSQLDKLLNEYRDDLGESGIKGKKFVVIGSGASGVEAAEWALSPPSASESAEKATILARDDKWIIPRNIVWDTLLSMQPFGREMYLSFIPEWLLRIFFYRDLSDQVAPVGKGIFAGTPIVNSTFLPLIRSGRAAYIRGDTVKFTERGVLVNKRKGGVGPGGEGEEEELEADIVVMATGFKKPGVDFLPDDLFPGAYERPNLYLQTFSVEDWSVILTNSSYVNAIGTVGHFHIGIYTRILLTLLLDKNARPLPKDMKLWVDLLRFVKRGASGGALSFFTYMELMIWLFMFHVFRPDRLRWIFFILMGWGVTWRDGEKKRSQPKISSSRFKGDEKGDDTGLNQDEKRSRKDANGKNK